MSNAENGPSPVDNSQNRPETPAPEHTASEAVAAAAVSKSRGQELLDRFLAVSKRIDGGARELEGARAWIDGPGPAQTGLAAQPQPKPAAKPTSFFEGMELIAGFLEDVAERQDKAVAGIKGLF